MSPLESKPATNQNKKWSYRGLKLNEVHSSVTTTAFYQFARFFFSIIGNEMYFISTVCGC